MFCRTQTGMERENTLRIILISNLLLSSSSLSDVPRYHDKKIAILLHDYFRTALDAPKLLGHSFHNRGPNTIFRIEIECNKSTVNKSLIFSFKAINMLAEISKKNFTHSTLVIHFEGGALPVVAEANIRCTKKFLSLDEIFEENWRKNCLTIKNY